MSESIDWTQYNPKDAENGKFVAANTETDAFAGYPTDGLGKFVMLAYDVSSTDVDFTQSYIPFHAENGKFVKLRSDSTLLSGYPSATGMGKYAVLTYNLNPAVRTVIQAASSYYTILTGNYVPLSGGNMTGLLFTPTLATTAISGIQYIDFNTAATITTQEGRMSWNTDDGTVNIGMPGGAVNLQVGQEQLLRVRNQSGTNITNGQVVYIDGAYSGQRPKISKASASSELQSHSVLGVATEDINDNSNGYITTIGLVRDIDTAHLTEGNPVYLGTTAGSLVSAAPSYPNHQVLVGYCVKSHATTGIVYVNIDLGFDVEDAHNASITNPVNDDVFTYNSTLTAWTNTPVSALVSRSPIQTERVLSSFTINTTSSVVLVSASSSTINATLPIASTQRGRTYTIKKIDSSVNYVTISANTFIDGAYTFDLTTQYDAVQVVSDGTQWWII